jgi:carboxypeptidase Taq
MPPAASSYRAEQNALLAKTKHEKSTSKQYEKALLDAFEEVVVLDDSHPNKIQVSRLKESFDKNKKISSDLVERLAKASVKGSACWEKAKEKRDSKLFLDELSNLVSLAKEKAESYGYEECAYDALISDFEPELKVKDFDALYNPLKVELSSMVKGLSPRQTKLVNEGDYDLEAQRKLTTKLAQELGFDFENGAIAESSHPFSITMGNNDFRITTRYLKDDPFSSFYATAHEIGHSLYERGLTKELFGTPLGEAASAGVHESQSLFWENRVCRSPEFISNWYADIKNSFSQMNEYSEKDLCQLINKVEPSFVRVEADETTYSLHIIIRYEIEKMLFSGEIEVLDVESVWNELYKKYLGLEVKDPRLGCLQDVHWSEGLFGYFPSYALGHILSAQFSEKMQADLGDLNPLIKNCEYEKILSWLGTNIHSKGQQYRAKGLIKNITGEDISSAAFVRYLNAKSKKVFS